MSQRQVWQIEWVLLMCSSLSKILPKDPSLSGLTRCQVPSGTPSRTEFIFISPDLGDNGPQEERTQTRADLLAQWELYVLQTCTGDKIIVNQMILLQNSSSLKNLRCSPVQFANRG